MAPQENFRSHRRLALAGRLVLLSWLWAACAILGSLAAETADKSVLEKARLLSPAEAAERVDALRTEIAFHDDLYFRKAAPLISDYAYDQLKRELAALEQAFPSAAREGNELEAGAADDRSGGFSSCRHRVRMLSLSKSYTEAELRAFDVRLGHQLGRREIDYVVEPKFDGLAISVAFEKGKFVRAVTRGNGAEGDDVTANVLTIRSLPGVLRTTSADGATVNLIPDVIELRGEIYLTFAEFERINRERENSGQAVFANPRNLAAGTLKQHDPGEVAKRRLEIVFYGMGACDPLATRPASQLGLLRQLRAWGLPTIESPRPARGIDAAWEAVQTIGSERERLGFPIDGAVVKLDSVALQDQIGVTAQAPLWAIAYKFTPERVETQIRAITLQVGRTGVVTPVAEFVPVQLGGATVARASLYNGDEIAHRDIRVGDFVYVEKAGEIIPAIAGVNRGRRGSESKPYVFPSTCPACRSSLVQGVGEVAWRCPSSDCPAQLKRRVEHFASAACVNIPGLGPAMVDKLVEHGWVKSVADLYRLRREDLLSLGGNLEKSTDRLLAAIEESKQAELWRFIHGLGIPQIGVAAARDLARHFGGLTGLAQAQRQDFFKDGHRLIPGVGESAARALLAYFAQPENQMVVRNLLTAGVRPSVASVEVGRPFAGKIFVLTGTLPNLNRAQAVEKIEAVGGTVASSVSRKTNWVLAGEGGGSKLGVARSLGVVVIDEAEFLRMLGQE